MAPGSGQNSRTASCVGDEASSSIHAPAALARCRIADPRRTYIEAVLAQYLWLPATPAQTSRSDRRLAGALYERGVPLGVVRTALLLGTIRRVFRSDSAPPLPPVRTLHYFLPVMEEILDHPLAPGYAEHIACKLASLAEAKADRLCRRRTDQYPSP